MTEKQEKRLIEALEIIAASLVTIALPNTAGAYLAVKFDQFKKGGNK